MLLLIWFLIFEFIMNKKMRIKQYKISLFIIKIFAVSVLSSFYSLLSSLSIMKKDPFLVNLWYLKYIIKNIK